MKQNLILALIIFLHLSCNSARLRETNPRQQSETQMLPGLEKSPEQDDYTPPIPKPQGGVYTAPLVEKKPGMIARLFSKDKTKAPRKVKYKNVTFTTNQQTASGGSTIGANTQAGPDNSKTKESAVTEAKTDNTAGQGSTQEVRQSAEAKSTVDKGGIKLWMLGLAVLVLGAVYWGYGKYRKTYDPRKWFV